MGILLRKNFILNPMIGSPTFLPGFAAYRNAWAVTYPRRGWLLNQVLLQPPAVRWFGRLLFFLVFVRLGCLPARAVHPG